METWRPSNGSGEAAFFERWCMRCQKDGEMNGTKPFNEFGDDDWCEILSRYFREDEPLPEWVLDKSGPRCTAFTPVGTVPRCTLTVDMFEQER